MRMYVSVGYSCYNNSVLYKTRYGNMVYDNSSFKYTQECETGQIVINVKKKRLVLLLTYELMSNSNYISEYLNHGDKDVFRIAFLICKEDVSDSLRRSILYNICTNY